MNIAIIIYSLTVSGGGQRQALELANALQKKGHKIRIFTTEVDKKNCYPELINNFDISALRIINGNPSEYSSSANVIQQVRNFAYMYKLGQLVSKEEFDIVNPHEWPASWIAIVSKILNPSNKKIIWMCNDLWHLYNPFQENVSLYYRLRARVDKYLVNKYISRILVLDNRMKRLSQKYYHLPIKVVRSGIDINKFLSYRATSQNKLKFRKLFGLKNNDIVLLSLSIFFPQRRFEDVVEAMNILVNKKRHQNIKYLIVGSNRLDIQYYEKIVSLIDLYKLGNYIKIITNPVSERELLDLYNFCDIFIFSNDKQTWGLAAIEAMAMGRPCVISKGSGVHEVIVPGKTALLAIPRSPKSFQENIEILLDSKKRKSIGKRAREFVLSNFSWEKYSNSLEGEFLNN